MKIFSLVMLFLIILSSVFISLASAIVNNYDYYFKLTVTNTGSTDYSGRVLFDVNPNSLIYGGYLQADADDILVIDTTDDLTGDNLVTAKNLASDSATWILGNIDVKSSESTSKYISIGNLTSTRDQLWYGDESDYNYIIDDNSLYCGAASILSVDITLNSTPSAESPIISKIGNYSLVADSTPSYRFSVWSGTGANQASVQKEATSNGDSQQLTNVGASTNWQCVSTAGDGTYVQNNGGASTYYDYYNLTLPDGCNITDVVLYYRVAATGGAANDWAYPVLYSEQTGRINGVGMTVPDAFTTGSESMTWTGGSDIQIGIGLLPDQAVHNNVKCSRLYAILTYDETGTKKTVSIPATIGEPVTLTCIAAPILGISISDTVNTGTDSLGADPFFHNKDAVYMNMVNASFNDESISNSSTTSAIFDFEPENITSTVISDQTAWGNDINYSISQASGISITLSALGYSESSYIPDDLPTQRLTGDFGYTDTKNTTVDTNDNNPLKDVADAGKDVFNFAPGISVDRTWVMSLIFVVCLIFAVLYVGRMFPDRPWIQLLAGLMVCIVFGYTGLISIWIPIIAGIGCVLLLIMRSTYNTV